MNKRDVFGVAIVLAWFTCFFFGVALTMAPRPMVMLVPILLLIKVCLVMTFIWLMHDFVELYWPWVVGFFLLVGVCDSMFTSVSAGPEFGCGIGLLLNRVFGLYSRT